MYQRILDIDHQLFNFINQRMQHPFLDTWMPVVTDIDNWVWLLVLGWVGLFIFGGRRGRLACIVALVAVLMADNFTSYILKPWFGRLRPNVVLEGARFLGGGASRMASPSFPSCHAANVFAMAMALSWYYPKITPIWFLGAVAVGYSRVYVGVHYPLDVIAGAFVGMALALCLIWCARRIELWIGTKKKGKVEYG